MPEIVTEIVIAASAERVWQVLTSLPAYPGWNPVLRSVQGRLAVGQSLTVSRIGANGRTVVERPTVVQYRPLREIRWRTRLALPWLLDTERAFKIEPLGPGRVRFVHWQTRSGVLAFLLAWASQSTTRDHFEVLNLALKAQIEHGTAAPRRPRVEHAGRASGVPGDSLDRQHHGAVSPI